MLNHTEHIKKKEEGARRIAKHDHQALMCPKCHTTLFVCYQRDVETGICARCQGFWVARSREKHVLNATAEVFSIDDLQLLPKYYKPYVPKVRSGYVPCPVCRQLMHRRNWGTHSGVIVDKCIMHGTWFDEGKIEKIKEYIKLGDIEYEKYILTCKEPNQLDYRIQKCFRNPT